MKTTIFRNDVSAFSQIELLTVVAALGILGSLAVTLITGSKQSVEMTKLEQDTKQINAAVKVFLGNGGSLDGITTAQEVIDELKRVADPSGQKRVVGLRGSLVDNRLVAVDESGSERRERAIWKNAIRRFVIETSTEGVREFRLDESLAGVDYGESVRRTALAYNGENGWVWDSSDYAMSEVGGPSGVPTLGVPTLGAGGGSGGANPGKLGTPSITPDSGSYELTEFPLQVTITKHPGDPITTVIYYSTSGTSWLPYTKPFSVEPGTSVVAYAATEDPNWEASDPAGATFNNDPVALDIALNVPKNPITYAEAGGALEPGNYTPISPVGPISVSLVNAAAIPAVYQHSGNFRVSWTYDGSDPKSPGALGSDPFSHGYPGDTVSYDLPVWGSASMLPVRVVAHSSNQSVVTDSPELEVDVHIARTDLRPVEITFNAETSGSGPVELEKVVDDGDMPVGARIYYTSDGTDPGDDGNGNPVTGTLYTGPFDPALNHPFASEAMIIARVYPPEGYVSWFNVSEPSSANYIIPVWEISGDATGWFSDPEGPSGMVSSIDGNETSSYFQWGDPGDWGTGANWLSFHGEPFEDVSSDERFLVGQLDYYNGTISLSSLATSIDFSVELAFDGTQRKFDYTFDLLTTPNTGTAWENADYVWFNDTVSSQAVNLYGADYSLNLEFGETSHYGFSSVDQFHVQETQYASVNVYATLVSIGSWW